MHIPGHIVTQPQEILGAQGVVADPAQMARYSQDWSGDLSGRPLAVARPANVVELARVLRLCAAEGVPVVPQGGHTGLVGGAVPSAEGNELIVSLERLDRVRSIDPVNFSMVAEAGCVRETLHRAVEKHDLHLPLSLGAKGSCQIGGNIATNAGGVNVLRYGMARDFVLGLEVVLPDGKIWNGLRSLRKNNTGYDLKQLFNGSEGTLVTAASPKLFPRPTQVQTVMLGVESISAAMDLYVAARRDLSDLLSAFELLPRRCIDLTLTANPALRDPLTRPAPVYVLMEAPASGLVDLPDLMERFLAGCLERERILDGVVAMSEAQAADFWRIGEDLVEAPHRYGRHLRTDVSVPISSLPALMETANAEIARHLPAALPIAYGHVCDGNVHYNVLPPKGLPATECAALLHEAEELILTLVDRFGGSISAEHGIGRGKRESFRQRLSEIGRDLLHTIKSGIDPHGRMSPGRIFTLDTQ